MDLPSLLRCGTLHGIFPLDLDSGVNNVTTQCNNGKIKDNIGTTPNERFSFTLPFPTLASMEKHPTLVHTHP